jgi:AcrR family transcriptional regulator
MGRKRNQERRRAELRHAAARAIATRGTTGISLRDIAQEANVSPSSVLYYYRDLNELVAEAIQHAMERFYDRRQEAVEAYDDPREQLAATLIRGFPNGSDDLDVLLLYLGVPVIRRSAPIAALTRSLTARQVGLYRSILDVGVARRVFALNDDAPTIAANLVALEDAYGLYVMNDNADRLPLYVARVVSFASTATSCDLRPIVDAMWPEAFGDGSDGAPRPMSAAMVGVPAPPGDGAPAEPVP